MWPVLWASLLTAAGALIFVYCYFVRGERAKSKADAPQPSIYPWVEFWTRLTTPLVVMVSLMGGHPAIAPLTPHSPFFFAGYAVAALGLLLLMWAMHALDRHFSHCCRAAVPKEVIRHGPYAYVRHPIYTANLLLMVGLLIATASPWLAFNLVLQTIFFVRSAHREETALREHFPEYSEYQTHTWRFFPPVW